MEMSPAELDSFRELWLAQFGEQISDARALKEAERLLILIAFAAENLVDPPLDDGNKRNGSSTT